MICPHSPWPLFGDDLDQARSWLKHHLNGVVSIRAGHLAISLGIGAELMDDVQSGELHADVSAVCQWQFRLARLRKEANPYRYLIPDQIFELSINALANSKLQGNTLNVELNGGIGDHLEALSLIMPWVRSFDVALNLTMSKERHNQIESLLVGNKKVKCFKNTSTNTQPIHVMAIRAALMEEASPPCYDSWIQQPQESTKDNTNYLCCWRAEGAGDKYSAHSRSIDWSMVHKFYKNLLLINQKARILDITKWNHWESEGLRAIGVDIIDPRKGTLIDLINKCHISQVITIDTALAHLCAASGTKANLLLNIFPDERWNELHRAEHSYGRLIKIWHSTQFGCWSMVLSELTNSLAIND